MPKHIRKDLLDPFINPIEYTILVVAFKSFIISNPCTIPSPIGYLDICFGNGAKRISRNSYIGFGKSYLIPETTKFDIGEGIVVGTLLNPLL